MSFIIYVFILFFVAFSRSTFCIFPALAWGKGENFYCQV